MNKNIIPSTKEIRREREDKFFKIVIPLVFIVACSAYGYSIINPPQKKLESGYVNQNKLEIKATDLDNNKVFETTLNYKGKSYLFKEDETGKPVVVPYSVIPQKI